MELAGIISALITMSICAFHFPIIYFNFFCADHGIPQTFDENLMPLPLGVSRG